VISFAGLHTNCDLPCNLKLFLPILCSWIFSYLGLFCVTWLVELPKGNVVPEPNCECIELKTKTKTKKPSILLA
jgi:hypothetical protein